MPCTPVIDPTCIPGQIVQNTAGRFLDELADQASQAAAKMLETLVAGWLAIPSPVVSQESGVIKHLQAYTAWAVAAIAVGSVLFSATKMALERDGREAGALGKNLVLLVVIAGAGVPAVRILTEIGDAYADWILSASANGDLGKRLLLLTPAVANTTGLPALVVIGISMMLFLSSMVQLLLLLARNAGLVLLAGLLPVAAAVGGSVRSRYLTWLLALVLYKPAAATIYAAVFWLGQGQSLTDLLTGLVMFAMAIVALPALMRLIAPAVSVLSGGGSGGVGVAAASGAGQVASGAVRLSGSGSGGAGATGNSGAAGGGRPGGAGPTPPAPRPSGGGSMPAIGGSGSAGASGAKAAGAGAGSASAGAGASGGAAAGAGAGAAAAAGPIGIAAVAAVAAAKAGPAAVRKVGGTASGAIDGEGS
ncbi:hypothetical protein [Micromonospora sp. RL09-050-HVF-A]|uniref:hypothetical protein n=1 Tax=Micromonospora sp. RL09-050-HVF-A TaxID=1703433 RepID=UPI001C5F61D5|nr:hypothetical protein [Micromonospora sp. RL09-050-HVF-A]MBW4700318.1 hypothetical protein [Micromonospora sp. RL09-050-HVF-A]